MRIVDARLQPISLRLRAPLVTARTRYASREGYVVRLRAIDDRGQLVEAQGEATPLEEFGTESHRRVGEVLSEATRTLVGNTVPSEVDTLSAWVDERVGPAEAVPASRFGVEVALLELLALEREVPLAQLLAPGARRTVPVSALLGSSQPETLAEEAARAVAEGFSTVKVKVGAELVGVDVRRIAAIRERVGASVRVRVDANGAWTPEQARSALAELAQFDLEFCEQPLAPGLLEELEQLADEVGVPIAADESVPRLVQAPKPSAIDVWVLKPLVLGGLLATLEHATHAAQLGIDVVVSSALDGPIARAAEAHLAAAVPRADLAAGLAIGQLFVDETVTALHPRRGEISIPSAPGLGLNAWELSRANGSGR